MRDGMIKFDDCFPIRASAWLRLLTLAENFGWEPIGQAMKERDPEYVNEENAEQGFVNNWDSYNVGNIQLLKKYNHLPYIFKVNESNTIKKSCLDVFLDRY